MPSPPSVLATSPSAFFSWQQPFSQSPWHSAFSEPVATVSVLPAWQGQDLASPVATVSVFSLQQLPASVVTISLFSLQQAATSVLFAQQLSPPVETISEPPLLQQEPAAAATIDSDDCEQQEPPSAELKPAGVALSS